MRKPLLTLTAFTIGVACAACQPLTVTSVTQSNSSAQQAAKLGTAALMGQVMVPSNVIAAGGANFSVLAGNQLAESPLVNGEVFLADTAGNPLPGFDPVKTGPDGRYTMPAVKAGYTFVVVAKAKGKDGKTLLFQTIAKVTDLGATADVDAATTLVATGVVADADGSLGSFNAFKFKAAAEATKKSLRADDLPDFGDRAAVAAKIRQLSETVAEIRLALDEVKQELAKIKSELANLQGKLDTALAGGRPGQVGEQGPQDCGRIFTQLDKDGDGRITLAEWTERFTSNPNDREDPKAIFIFVDRNADGALTREEFVPECEKHQAEGGERNGDQQQGSCEDGLRFMDQDRSGTLSLDEFKRGHRPPQGESTTPAETIFSGIDRNRDGVLSGDEFLEACNRRGEPGPQQQQPAGTDCEGQFAFMDRTPDGFLDPGEFKAGFRPRPGETITAEEVFGHLDRNRDGRIDRQEYLDACRGANQAPPQGGEVPPPNQPTTESREALPCPDRFKLHDKNRDGRIDLEELRAGFQPSPGSVPPEEVYRQWDTDRSGFVEEPEFMRSCEGQPAP